MQSFPDFARSETVQRAMTNRIISQPDEQPAPPPVVRTPVDQRMKPVETPEPALPVQLHREDDVGAVAETVGACKRACQGLAYDLRHWKNLPGATIGQKMQVATTRGGRLPYLVLTIPVAFLAFFTVLYLVKWTMGNRRSFDAAGSPRIVIAAMPSNAGPAAAAPVVGPNLQPQTSNVA